MVESDPAELTGLAGWAADVMADLGAWGVGLLTAIENLFPPIPSEVVLPLAGYLVSQDRMGFIAAVIASTLGSVLGAIILFETAAALGVDRMRRLVHGIPLVDWEDVDRAQGWFDRHGTAAIFFGRFVPGVRSLVSIPAGTSNMRRPRFLFYTTLGSGVWNTAFVGLGWALGSAWTSIGRYSNWINWGFYVLFALSIGRFVWNRRERIGLAG